MKYRYIPAFVMLLAGLVCCVLSVVQQWPVMTSLTVLILVLVVFYIVGQIAAQVVGKVHAEHQAMVEAERKRLEEEERLRQEQLEQEELEAQLAAEQEKKNKHRVVAPEDQWDEEEV